MLNHIPPIDVKGHVLERKQAVIMPEFLLSNSNRAFNKKFKSFFMIEIYDSIYQDILVHSETISFIQGICKKKCNNGKNKMNY